MTNGHMIFNLRTPQNPHHFLPVQIRGAGVAGQGGGAEGRGRQER